MYSEMGKQGKRIIGSIPRIQYTLEKWKVYDTLYTSIGSFFSIPPFIKSIGTLLLIYFFILLPYTEYFSYTKGIRFNDIKIIVNVEKLG